MLTSNKVLTIKLDKPDLNIPDDPTADAIVILAIILFQLSFYVFVLYWDSLLVEKKKNIKETDVDKIDDTHKEEQHANDIDN